MYGHCRLFQRVEQGEAARILIGIVGGDDALQCFGDLAIMLGTRYEMGKAARVGLAQSAPISEEGGDRDIGELWLCIETVSLDAFALSQSESAASY